MKDVAQIAVDGASKFTVMLSNVPGPLEKVQLLGQYIEDMAFHTFSPFSMYFGVIQYAGSFRVGINTDATCEPEPSKLAEFWGPAFEDLHTAVMAA